MAICLWAGNLERELTAREREQLAELLPPERRTRLERVPDRRQWREPLCAYGLLALALRETRGWDRLPAMTLGERGKPFFPEHPEQHFCISHTHGGVLVGLSGEPVGVDLEWLGRPMRSTIRRRLEQSGQTPLEYYQDWVRYEAAVKRRGGGVRPHHRPEDCENAQLVDLLPDYAAAVCGGEALGSVRRLSLEDLLDGLFTS